MPKTIHSQDKQQVANGRPVVVRDRATYKISRREFTDNGYLKVPGRVARTGVQYYLAHELELTDRNPMDRIGVYRPADEVFSADSLSSYADADVTIEHPGDMVSADTYRKHSVGHVTDAARQDGEYVEADLIIKDADAIKEVEAGRAELSAGYLAEYVPEKGVTDSGEEYEFVQRNIRINHVALVSAARAGHEARLYDTKPQEAEMYQVTMDGKTVKVADESTAQLIQASFDSLRERVGDAESKASQALAAKDAAEAKADKLSEDKAALEAKTSDEAIQERVKAIHDAQTAAHALAGEGFVCDSLDPMEMKRAALAVVRPSIDWAQKPESYIAAAFDMSYSEKMEKEEEDEKAKKAAQDSAAGFAKDLSGAKDTADNQLSTLDAAIAKRDERIANAWKEAK